MDDYAMSPAEAHYQQQPQQQRQWPPHLLPPMNRGPSSFPSPVSPAADFSPHQQNAFYHHNQPPLSLNLSSLSVTSPPVSQPSSAIDPVTPISPSGSQHPFHSHLPTHAQQQQQQTPQAQAHFTYHDPYPPSSSRSSSSSTTSTPSGIPRKRSFTGNSASSNTNAGPSTPATLLEADEESMFDDMNMSTPAYDDVSGYPNTGGGGGNSPVDGTGSSGDDACGSISQTGGMLGGAGAIGVSGSGVGMTGVMGKPLATNNFVTKLYQMINDPKSANFIVWTELGTSFVVSNVGEFSRSILGSHFKHNNFSSFVRQLNMYGFHKINRTPRAQRTSTDAQTWEFSHRKFLRGRPDLLDEIKRKALEPDPGVKQRVELPGEVANQLGAMREENRKMWEQLTNERKRVEQLTHVVGRLWDIVSKAVPGAPPFPSDLLDPIDIFITSPTDGRQHHLLMNQSTNSTPHLHQRHTQHTHTPPSLSAMSSVQSLHITPNSSPTAADFPNQLSQQQQQQSQSGQVQQSGSGQQQQQQQQNQQAQNAGTGRPPQLSRQHSFQHVSFSRGHSASPVDSYGDGLNGSLERNHKRPRTGDGDDPMGGVSSTNGGASGGPAAPPPSLPPPASSVTSSIPPPNGNPMMGRPTKPLSTRARSDSAPLGMRGYGGYGGFPGAPGVNVGGGGGGVSGRPRSGSGFGIGLQQQQQQQQGGGGGPGTIPNIGGRAGLGAIGLGLQIGGGRGQQQQQQQQVGQGQDGQQGVQQQQQQNQQDVGAGAGGEGPPMLPMLSMSALGSVGVGSCAPSPVR